ncbi:MAG: hypothetical protein N2512_12615 [Armatimonadetes bacterium]|nr:hypothetical protein [Armatimonadota bacterium]
MLLAFLVCTVTMAAEVSGPQAPGIPLTPVWRPQGPIRIPIGERPQVVGFDLPAVRVTRGYRAILRFQACLTTPGCGGWNEYLAVVVNGQAAGPRTADGRPRLVNRMPMWYGNWHGRHWFSLWRERNGYPCLNVWFAPDYQTRDPSILSTEEELYWYALDVTDLVRSEGPNHLEFVNTALRQYWGGAGLPESVVLEVADAELGVVSEKHIGALPTNRPESRRWWPGPRIGGRGWQASVSPGGGIQLQVAADKFFMETSHAVLKQQLKLACGDTPLGWQLATEGTGQAIRLVARSDRLSLVRTLRPDGHRLLVEDELTNRAGRELGVTVEHFFVGPRSFSGLHLAGNEVPTLAAPEGVENCTAHAAAGRSAVGLLVLDDFFRAHFCGLGHRNWLRLWDETFALAAGDSYRFRFALYPAAGLAPVRRQGEAVALSPVSYWSFLNQVRRDIGVNFTVDGPMEFFAADDVRRAPDAVRSILRQKPVRIFALQPWFEYYNGALISRPDYEARMREAITMVKAVAPGAKCVAMLETNLVSVPKDWFRGTLPSDWGYGHYESGVPHGKYGIAPPPEAQAIIEASPWADSMLRDDQARPLLDTFYVLPPYGYVDLMCYPRDGNYREQQMLEQIAFVLDKVGFDGVYLDQFTMSSGTHAYDYGRWDGHTSDLDPATGDVVCKYAYVAISSAAARRRVVLDVLRRGKIVVTNGPPASWVLQDLPIFRFMETQGYNVEGDGLPHQPVLATGQLGSPIGLGHAWQWRDDPEAGRYFMRTLVAHLRYGMTYYFYGTWVPQGAGSCEIVGEMFPITPVQLGEGYIVGRERLVTCRSGNYWLPWDKRPEVMVFSEKGLRKAGSFRVSGNKGHWRVDLQLADFREAAVVKPQ